MKKITVKSSKILFQTDICTKFISMGLGWVWELSHIIKKVWFFLVGFIWSSILSNPKLWRYLVQISDSIPEFTNWTFGLTSFPWSGDLFREHSDVVRCEFEISFVVVEWESIKENTNTKVNTISIDKSAPTRKICLHELLADDKSSREFDRVRFISWTCSLALSDDSLLFWIKLAGKCTILLEFLM